MKSISENIASGLHSQSRWLVRGVWATATLWTLYVFGLPLVWDPPRATSLLGTSLLDRDFINYWVAAKQVLAGEARLLFTHDTYVAQLQSLAGDLHQTRSWSYPPHYLLLIWPVGWLEYQPALAAFLVGTIVLFAVSVVAARNHFAPEVSLLWTWVGTGAFVVMACATTQNGFLTGALMLAALTFMHSRPWLAGLALAILTVKPHLGLLFVVVVLMDRNWRVFWWAVGCTAGLVALSMWLFGLDCWLAYIREVIPYQRHVMIDWQGIFLRMMPSTFGALRTLRFYPYDALLLHAAFALVVLRFLVWPLLKSGHELFRAFALLVGTFVITPYAFNYDMGALTVMSALFAQSLVSCLAGARAALVGTITLVAVLPAAMLYLGLMRWPISPLLLVAALALTLVVVRRDSVRDRYSVAP